MDTKIPEMSHPAYESVLSPQQLQAISLIMAGKNITAVAAELHCSRKTLAKWKSSNPHFVAELNGRKNELMESARDRLHSLVNKAISVLEQNLDEGNCTAALNLLKMVDLKPKELETDVEILVKQQAEDLALAQLYGTVPFTGKLINSPWHTMDHQTQTLASDICLVLRTHYGISADALDELQGMSEANHKQL